MEDWARVIADLFEQELFNAPSTEDLFNMYRDRIDGDRDVAEAPEIRRQNLMNYLAAYRERPPVLLVIEAPGPWGCRFSGVPITSEAQLLDPSFPISGSRTSTRAEPMTEYSAGIFWRILQPAFPRFFIWNTVPFHPFHKGRPDTIRGPRVTEIRRFAGLSHKLIDILQPEHVLAVGRKAERLLRSEIGIECTYARHPSQGGATQFERAMQEVFGAT